MNGIVQILKDALIVLVENAPFAFVSVMAMIFAYKVYSKGVGKAQSAFDKALSEVAKAHNDAHKNSQETIMELYKILHQKK